MHLRRYNYHVEVKDVDSETEIVVGSFKYMGIMKHCLVIKRFLLMVHQNSELGNSQR